MLREFDVNWTSTCYRCQNPLNIYITFSDTDEYFGRDLCSFYRHKDINFVSNLSMYKTMDGRAYKYCLSCHTVPCIDINRREVGVRVKPLHRSLFKHEIYDWFKDFYGYLNRIDVSDHVVKSVTRRIPPGLSMVLTY